MPATLRTPDASSYGTEVRGFPTRFDHLETYIWCPAEATGGHRFWWGLPRAPEAPTKRESLPWLVDLDSFDDLF